MLKKTFLLSSLLLLCLITTDVMAQFYPRSAGYWRQNRVEIIGQLGANVFRGDVGQGVGADRNGLGSLDLWNPLRFTANLGARYFVTRNVAIRGSFTLGRLYSADEDGNERTRINRNLRFRTDYIDANAIVELHILRERTAFRSAVRGSRGKAGFSVGVYTFGGIGIMAFNPKAQVYDPETNSWGGSWHALQPLGTEGQLLEGGEGKYSRIAATFPFGIGIRKSITRNISVGLEMAYVFTTTDYLDDVSTTYANLDALAAQNPLAAQLADPSIGRTWTPEQIEAANLGFTPNASWTGEGQLRGHDGANDAYLYTVFNIVLRLPSGPKVAGYKPKRIAKNKKIVF
jgi:hypothetical protein